MAQNHQAVAGRRMPVGRNGVSSSSRRYNNRGLYYAAAAAGGEAVTKRTFIGYRPDPSALGLLEYGKFFDGPSVESLIDVASRFKLPARCAQFRKFISGSVDAFGGRSFIQRTTLSSICKKRGCSWPPRAILLPMEKVMKRFTTLTLTTGLLLGVGLALPNGDAVGQQQTGPTLHRYLVRADLTAEGIKNLQKQPPTALKAGVAKFVESIGGKLEFWFFDYGESTAYSVIDYPDEIAAATAQLSTNAAGFARVRIRPLLSAEEMDRAVAKVPPVRVPQQQ